MCFEIVLVKQASGPPRINRNHVLLLALVISTYMLGLLTPWSKSNLPYPTRPRPFYVLPKQFVDPKPLVHDSHYPEPTVPTKKGQVVPNVVHYVYGLKPTKAQESTLRETPDGFLEGERGQGDEFPYYAYLAIRSVVVNIKPETIYFHHFNTPTGIWWDEIRPFLTLIEAHVPTRIFGNEVRHFAHRSDVSWQENLQLHIGPKQCVCTAHTIRRTVEYRRDIPGY